MVTIANQLAASVLQQQEFVLAAAVAALANTFARLSGLAHEYRVSGLRIDLTFQQQGSVWTVAARPDCCCAFVYWDPTAPHELHVVGNSRILADLDRVVPLHADAGPEAVQVAAAEASEAASDYIKQVQRKKGRSV